MGRAIESVAHDNGLTVVAIIDAGHAITRASLAGADVAIEFTEPSAAIANAEACVAAECPIVVGTTGWYDQLPQLTRFIEEHHGSLFWAANFSLGVNLFAEIVRYAGQLLADVPGFDVQLIETHHTQKKGAPSGTAVMLRNGIQPALRRELPVTSLRIGSVPGTHELVADAKYEQITLTHTARDRRVFAEGAVAAARWLVGRTGVYTIADMLGTRGSSL
jgi:4-hydroxy-tetrahydrodipicolinate reductase